MKQVPTVRVVWFSKEIGDKTGLLLENLRYMGFVKILKNWEPIEPFGDNAEGKTILEFTAPKGLRASVWCEQNAARMRSFEINAVVAPQWHGIGDLLPKS